MPTRGGVGGGGAGGFQHARHGGAAQRVLLAVVFQGGPDLDGGQGGDVGKAEGECLVEGHAVLGHHLVQGLVQGRAVGAADGASGGLQETTFVHGGSVGGM